MTVQDILRDPELLKSYREWLSHPMTKTMRDMAVKFSRPVGLPTVSGDSALYAQGHAVASSNFLRVIFELEDLVEEQRQIAKLKMDPEYGLRSIMENYGYPQPARRGRKVQEDNV